MFRRFRMQANYVEFPRNSRPMAMIIKKYGRWRIYRTNDVVLYLVSIPDRKLKLCRISYRLAEVQETLQFCIGRRALCNRQQLYGWLYHLPGVIANRSVHSHFKTVDYKYSFCSTIIIHSFVRKVVYQLSNIVPEHEEFYLKYYLALWRRRISSLDRIEFLFVCI